jgi:hypothetical protein
MLGISSVEKVGLKGKWGAKKGAKPLDFIGFYWTLLDKQNPSIGLWSQLREVVGGDGGELNSRRGVFGLFSTRCSPRPVAPAALPTSNERHRSFLSVHKHPF